MQSAASEHDTWRHYQMWWHQERLMTKFGQFGGQDVSGQIPAAYSHCLLNRSHWVRKAETLWGERVRVEWVCVCVCVCARLGFQSHTEWCWFTEWLGDSRSGVTAGHTKSDSGCWEGMWIKVQSMKIHPLTLRGLVLGCMTARIGQHLHMWAMIWISGTFSSPWGILLALRMLGVHSHCHVFNGGR